MKQAFWIALVLCLVLAPGMCAHVGSPDVYYEGMAGPYRLFVTVRVPQMIPGVAQVEVRALQGAVSGIRIVPLRVIGEGSENAPPADRMEQSAADPQFFSGKLWLMESGSWQVRMEIVGAEGNAQMAVPVAAFAQRTLRMEKTTGAVLSGLMIFLVLSLISILGAATRESQLEPGTGVPPAQRNRARIAMLVATVLVVAILFLGNMWWGSIATTNAKDMVYKAPPVEASIVNGNELVLKLGSSYWHERRKQLQLDRIIPDHGHLMHLFLIRKPGMDRFLHLHPDQKSADTFSEALRAAPSGDYAVFADIVRESGFPDTMTSTLTLPEVVLQGRSFLEEPDNSSASAEPVSTATPRTIAILEDGEQVERLAGDATLQAQNPVLLRFRVEDKSGKPARDLEPYMGMAGHLVIVRHDFSVFAHVHPAGSVPMAALMLVEKAPGENRDSMPGMQHGSVAAEITFPYGFPQAGDYRLFLQVKRAGRVETAVFDTHVAP
jgi:hypothetical protein